MPAAAAVAQFQFHCTLAANTPVADRPHAAAQLLAGAILDALRTLDPRSRVACDVHSDAKTLILRGHVSRAGTRAEAAPPQDLVQPEQPVLDYEIRELRVRPQRDTKEKEELATDGA